MLTGIATGFFENLEDAADHMVEQTVTYYPREAMHEKYMQIYERYEKVYEAVRPLVQKNPVAGLFLMLAELRGDREKAVAITAAFSLWT